MTAEAILAYYDEMGFKDWEHTETGAPMLKAQHPEFETIYGGAQSSMAKQDYTCADCHMAPAKAEDGTEYSSHKLVYPTEDPAIMEKCEGCHADLPGQIVQWQKETTDREHELAAKLDAYIKTLAEQNGSAVEVEEWGSRKLAYPINYKTEGYYVLMTFVSGPEFPRELDRKLRIAEGVMRSLIVCKDE